MSEPCDCYPAHHRRGAPVCQYDGDGNDRFGGRTVPDTGAGLRSARKAMGFSGSDE